MKNFVFLPVLFVLSAGSLAQGSLSIGDHIPKSGVKMQNVDNKQVSIADQKGEAGTLVVFSCNHCPYAKAWEKRIVNLAADAKDKKIGVIMINSNDPSAFPEDGFEKMKAKGYSFPYVVDSTSDMARSFGATNTPQVFLFDKTGTLVYKGAVDDNSEDENKVTKHFLQDALDQMAAGRKIAMAETKAVGCGIKFRH